MDASTSIPVSGPSEAVPKKALDESETLAQDQKEGDPGLGQFLFHRRIIGVGKARTFTRSPSAAHISSIENEIREFMNMHKVAGLMVLLNGEALIEKYGMNSSVNMRLQTIDVTQSILATMVGAALQDGLLALDTRTGDVIGHNAGPIYSMATVYQLLKMQSGVKWQSGGKDADDLQQLIRSGQLGERGATLSFLATLPADPSLADGDTYNYNPGDFQVLAEVLDATVRRHGYDGLSDYLSVKVVQPFKMGSGAWASEIQNSGELIFPGIALSLSDTARFAQGMVEEMKKKHSSILPNAWYKNDCIDLTADVSLRNSCQAIIVMPDEGLVYVLQSGVANRDIEQAQELHEAFQALQKKIAWTITKSYLH
ncbi:CubicO group peptidase (beta-lactamase class C family) [Robbsia andropogonis]|uniref:serine hydrolase n=1 Tax=Robbsia andropogonis TaxID=28092 RepID=UPI003D212032